MRVQVAIPEPHVSAPVLDAALEGVTRLNEEMLAEGEVPTFREAVERVRWKPEPPGQEHFDHAKMVLGRGWGDCDDLAPWHAASLRATGEDPGAHAVVRKSGPNRWHAIVQRSDGSLDDPSREAGMGQPRGVHGAAVPVMYVPRAAAVVGGAYVARPQLALRPVRDGRGQIEAWEARADLPWHWQPGDSPGDIAMASLHASPISSQAIVGACEGAAWLGEASGFSDDEHIDRVGAIADMCDGADWDEVAAEYGDEHADAAAAIVGSFFGSLARAAKGLARHAMPIARMGLPFVPGVGPLAAKAFEMAAPSLQRLLQERGHLPPPDARRFVARQRAPEPIWCIPVS
jgi:hypothetical protein